MQAKITTRDEEPAFFIHFQEFFSSQTTRIDPRTASFVYQIMHQLCRHSVTKYTCAHLCRDVDEALKDQPPKPPTPRARPESEEERKARVQVPDEDDDDDDLKPGDDLAAKIAKLIRRKKELKDELQKCLDEKTRLLLALSGQLPPEKVPGELVRIYDSSRKTETIMQQKKEIADLMEQTQKVLTGAQRLGSVDIIVQQTTGRECKGESTRSFLDRFLQDSAQAKKARPDFQQAREAMEDVKKSLGQIAQRRPVLDAAGATSSYYY